MDVFGFMDMMINAFDGGIVVVGGLLTLVGVVLLGLGLFDVYNHFKPENRDNPGEKNRFVSGIVKFTVGGLLATSGYQVLATNTFEDGGTTNTITYNTITQPSSEMLDIAGFDSRLIVTVA